MILHQNLQNLHYTEKEKSIETLIKSEDFTKEHQS